MLLNVRVIPKSSRDLVKRVADGFKVYLTKPAQDNLANIQLVELLADYLNIRKYRIKIIKGHKSRNKLVEIH